jgi:murein DD-endopeptidase MepM/ murein hydrolase activator NlpD
MGIMGRPSSARGRAPRRAVALLAGLTCAAGVAIPSSASAATDPGVEKRKVDAKVDALKNDVEDTSAALKTAYGKLKSTESKIPAARDVLAKAQAAADAADRANTVAAQELEVALANEKKAQADLAKANTAVDAGRKRLAQFAAQIYQEQGFGQLDVALSSTDPQQFADRIALVDTVMDVQGQTMDRLATEQASLTALEDHVSALRADSARKKKAAEDALARAQSARGAAQKAKADLEALAASQKQDATQFADQLAADKKQLAQMQAEQARLKQILLQRAAEARRRAEAARKKAAAEAAKRARQHSSSGTGSSSSGSGGSSSSSSAVLSRPVRTGWVSSEYGMRYHPIYHVWRLHSGRDYAVPCGTPVYAAGSGDVIMAGWATSYGNRVVIDHGLHRGVDLASTYNHLTSIVVHGGHVSRGQLIAYSGSTGTSTGCHLHFETLANGSFTDPRTWL